MKPMAHDRASLTKVVSDQIRGQILDGKVVGSVAASGGNGEQDTVVCEAGIAAFMKHLGK